MDRQLFTRQRILQWPDVHDIRKGSQGYSGSSLYSEYFVNFIFKQPLHKINKQYWHNEFEIRCGGLTLASS